MTILQGQTTAFKANILSGVENFTLSSPYVYKVALYTSNANLTNSTATYASTTNEIVGTGYTAGGKTLVISNAPTQDTTNNVAYISFSNAVWSPATFTCRAALIYNSTTGASVAVLDFGSDKSCSNSFTITFPTATSTSAIIRIS
jgi:hypothetical protein